MPYPLATQTESISFVDTMQSIFGNIFIGGAMLLLLPAFLLSIVQERELRLKAMMKIVAIIIVKEDTGHFIGPLISQIL